MFNDLMLFKKNYFFGAKSFFMISIMLKFYSTNLKFFIVRCEKLVSTNYSKRKHRKTFYITF